MRQAYDYWQNQPGNYHDRDNLPPRGGKEARERPRRDDQSRYKIGASRGRTQPVTSSRGRGRGRPERGTSHPIAPTEFLKGRSAADATGSRPPKRTAEALQHVPLKRRIPATRSRPGDGYGLGMTPDCLMNNVCHRPTIHRLLQSSRSTGPTSLPDHLQRDPTAAPSPKVRQAPRHGRQWDHLPGESQLGRPKTHRCPITPPTTGGRSATKRNVRRLQSPANAREIGHGARTAPSQHADTGRLAPLECGRHRRSSVNPTNVALPSMSKITPPPGSPTG